MDSSFLSDVNWLHVLVAAIAYFAIGGIWYSALFGRKWAAYQGVNADDPEMKKGAAAIMFSSFIWMFVSAAGLEILINRLDVVGGAMSGIKIGLLTGICFSAAAISISYLYVKKPAGLHLIDCLYHILGQIIAAIILCTWQ